MVTVKRAHRGERPAGTWKQETGVTAFHNVSHKDSLLEADLDLELNPQSK
jgi:hypothetical protein